jgi:hypothetical protein
MSAVRDDPAIFRGNARVGGEGRHFDELADAHRAQLVRSLSDHEAHRERLLADVDTFSGWLSGECYQAPPQKLPRIAAGYPPFMENLPTPQVVALLLHPRADVMAAAMDELRSRYLARFGVEG